MNEDRFWSMIEEAWGAAGGKVKARQKLAEGKLSEEKAEELMEAVEEVIPALTAALEKLPAEELLDFDRILERKLYDIDRAEVPDSDGRARVRVRLKHHAEHLLRAPGGRVRPAIRVLRRPPRVGGRTAGARRAAYREALDLGPG